MKKVFALCLLVILNACTSPTPTIVAPSTIEKPATPIELASAAPTPSPIITPAPRATLPAPSATIVPTLAPTVTPTPALTQLTQGGCCVQPFWSADSQQVLFIDKPNAQSPSGIYGVEVNANSPSVPKLITDRVAFYTSDLKYAFSFEGEFTVIEHEGKQSRLRTQNRPVSLSPDRTRVVWNETSDFVFPIENRVTNVMLANLDGTGARKLTTALRGGASGWLDEQHLLMTQRASRDSQDILLYTFSLADGGTKELARSDRLRAGVPSRGGNWIAYTILYDEDASQDGLWLIRSDGTARSKLNFFSAFQWRDEHRLIYVPVELGAASHAFFEYDADTGARRALTNPGTTSFKIANGDWAISPDGSKIVFVSAQDSNLWLVRLP